jgi:autotransporter-associated beta strand protein
MKTKTNAIALACLAAVALVAPDRAVAQTVTTSTVTFQQGTNGYTGGSDRTISTGNATAGTTGTMDMNDGTSGESQYFVLFDSIFGSGSSQIPAGATILDASLTLRTGGGSNNQSGGNFTVAGLRTSFSGGTALQSAFPGVSVSGSTTSALNGPTYANGLITLPVAAYRGPALSTAYSAFVAPLVQQWASGSTNFGIAVQPHTTDAWVVAATGNATVANRPALAVTYTTAPTTTSSIKSGMTLVTLNGVTNVTTDASSSATVTVDGATGGALPGDANSPDLLGLVKIDSIFGSGPGQVPTRSQVLKAWFVVGTTNGSSDESNGSWGVYRMNTAWSATTQYSSFSGTTGPVAGADYVAAATATIGAMPKNTQAWADVTADVNAWKAGTANNGLMIRAIGTNSDGWVFGGPTNADANRRPELKTIYSADAVVWTGSASSGWDKGTAVDVGGTPNWATQTGGIVTNFIDTDAVIFDDTAAGTGVVSVVLDASVAPRKVTFAGGSRPTTVSGTGGITGAGLLVKSGTGRVILATNNTATGGTTIEAGTLQIGSGGSAGTLAGNVAIAAGATLEFNRSGTSSFAGVISGSGGIVKTGPGRVSITGSSSFEGPVVVTAGALGMAPFTAAGGITVASGASLAVINSGSEQTLISPTLALGTTASDLRFELASPSNPSIPLLSVTTPDGLALSGGAHTLSVATSGALSVGRFTLIDYAGSPISAGFTLAALPQRLAGSLVYDTTNTKIDLDITGLDTLRWIGQSSGVWDVGSAVDVGGTVNWQLASSSSATNFVAGDQVRFDDSALGGGVSLAADVAPGSVVVDNTAVEYTFSGAGSITGSPSFVKQGAGRATLLVSNSSAGLTTVSAGTLQVGDATTAPTIAGPVVLDGGLLDFRNGTLSGSATVNTAATATFASGTVATQLTVAGGTATLSGASLAAGANVASGLLSIGTGGTVGGVAGSIAIAGPGTLALNHTNDLTYAGVLSGSGAITKEGSGRSVLTASSTGYTGTITIHGGLVSVEDPNNNAGDINAASIVVNSSGTFQFGNATIGNPDLPTTTFITANTGGRVIWQEGEDLGGVHLTGGEIDLQQGGITSSGTAGVQTWTSGRLTGSGTAAQTLGGATAIVKTTSGTVTVDGLASITATGGVTVEDGSLRLATAGNLGTAPLTLGGVATAGTVIYGGSSATRPGSVTFAAGGGTVEVTSPAAVLTLSGSVSGSGPLAKTGVGTLLLTGSSGLQGAFTVVSGTLGTTPFVSASGGAVAAGAGLTVLNPATTTTLAVPTLSLGAGSTLGFTLTDPGLPTLPLLAVTSPNGLTLSGSVTVSLASSQGLGVGRFTLVEYDGTPLPASFALGSLPPRVLATLVNDTVNTRFDLDVLGTGQLRWRGDLSSAWNSGSAVDVGGTFNWTDAATGTATNFIGGDRVLFDDTAAAASVTVDEVVSPAEIAFNNSGVGVRLSGSGAIAGGAITKTGTGLVTLAVAKTGTQATTISAGTLQVGDALASGSFAGPVTVSAGGAFDVRNGVATGRVTVAGGVATVTGSLAAGATVTAGDLRIGVGGTAGGLAGNVAVGSGGTMTVNRSDALTYSGTLSGAGTLVKTGSGLFTILANSTGFTGTVVVNGGELALEDRGQGGDLNATSIVINDGGRFTFGAPGNADFPQTTNVTINAGGLFDLQQGENWGGLILDGGTLRMSGTRTGVNTNLDRMDFRSGRVEASFTGGGTGGQLIRLASSQFLQKTGTGTVSFGPGVSLQADLPVNLENGTLDFDVTALPATGNGAFTIGDVGNPVTLRVSGVGTGTFGRYAYVGNPSLTIDVADAAATMAVVGTVEGGGAVIKTGSGTLDLRQPTALTNTTTVAGGTLRVSNAGALATSETLVQAGATLEVASGVTIRSPKVTVDGGTLLAGALAVDSTSGVTRVEIRGAGGIAGVPAVTVGAGGALVLSSSASLTAQLTSLSVAETTGLVDLGAGGFVIAAGGITPADLMADLAAGRGDGSWNGTAGITSSLAAASGGSRTIGWLLDGNDGTIRVGFAAAGDTNLDGMIDIGDVANFLGAGLLDTGSPATWGTGDFNLDGFVDQLDLADFLSVGLYDAGSYLPASSSAAPPAAVPEPAVAGLAVVAAAVLLVRRRVWLPVRDGHGVRGARA